MQPEYLARLSAPVQQFVFEVEEHAGVEITVIPDPELNRGGTTGQGNLAVIVDAQSVRLFVPSNGYFPDGAVRHEVLHVRRFHVEAVPKLALADSEPWDKALSDSLGAIDNAIEHVVFVPEELNFHPERLQHWEDLMRSVCSQLPYVPEEERGLAVGLHWTFLRHVLPNSPLVDVVRTFGRRHGLLEMADHFADQFVSAMASKEELVRILFLTFPEIPKQRASLEYISSTAGRHQKPIP